MGVSRLLNFSIAVLIDGWPIVVYQEKATTHSQKALIAMFTSSNQLVKLAYPSYLTNKIILIILNIYERMLKT